MIIDKFLNQLIIMKEMSKNLILKVNRWYRKIVINIFIIFKFVHINNRSF